MQLAEAQAQHSADTAEMAQLQSQIQELQEAVVSAVNEIEAQASTDQLNKAELAELRKQLQAKDAELEGQQSVKAGQEV